MKAVVAAFNQEKALVGAFSVLTNLRMELFQAIHKWKKFTASSSRGPGPGGNGRIMDRGRLALCAFEVTLLAIHCITIPIYILEVCFMID